MELSDMSSKIIKIINKQYKESINLECVDLMQIKDICSLYKIKQNMNNCTSVNLSEIKFSSPEFKKISSDSKKKKQNDVLKSKEFIKKYSFFIKIIYACLKIGVDMFNMDDDVITLKNNYQLKKSLETKKKKFVSEHLTIIKNQYKNISQKITPEYETYFHDYVTKIKIIDKIIDWISKLIVGNVLGRTDNLLTLILPYFYTYTEFIEEYN
jgi:hypothetical protein